MLSLQNQVALVTGAGRGIGRSIALALAHHGAHVILTARTDSQLRDVSQAIAQQGGSSTPIPSDISNEASLLQLFQSIDRSHNRLDILINNAGIGIFGPLAEFSAADFDRILAINLRGTFLCCREALKRMIPRSSGYIINISSVVGFKGYPNQAAYTASKHGIMGLTKSLAVEAQKHRVRISAILPGGVDTDLVGDARPDLDRSILLSPDDIAQSVLYLLSLSENAAVDEIYIRRRGAAPF